MWSAAKVVSAASDLEAFFGAPLARVPLVLRLIATGHQCPEWLRGVSSVTDLPRYVRDVVGDEAPLPRHYDAVDLAERIVWIVETLRGEWRFTTKTPMILPHSFVLADDADIVHYRIRWS